MKNRERTLIVLIAVLLIVTAVLGGCVKKTEYDNKEIVSIHYNTTESFMPWQDHKFYDFAEMTYSTKRVLAEWYEDIESEFMADYVPDEYALIATFTEEKAEVFFNSIKKHGVYNLEKNYHDYHVDDGYSWHLTIAFSDGTTFESGGYMQYPKQERNLNKDFVVLAGYKLFGN